ncbi:MAG: hypothetical protein NVS1B11_03690 [Terriglobales bacterium]
MVLFIRQFNLPKIVITNVLFAVIVTAPLLVHAQCQSTGDARTSKQSESPNTPQFFDEPQFNVAGVTDTTNLGGHGSDATLRTNETLAKETVALSKTTLQPTGLATANEEFWRNTVARDPQNFDANYRLGKLLVENGGAEESLVYLERAAQLNPASYENSYELARAYFEFGKYEHARSNTQALIHRVEQRNTGENREERAQLYHLLGDIEEKLQNSLGAVRAYECASEISPIEPNLFDWGAELLMHHAPEPALEVFARGSRLFPQSTRILLGLGASWYVHGSYDQAVRFICAASDENPTAATPYLFLGKIQSAAITNSEVFVKMFERFVHFQPESALANYYYAVSLWKQQKSSDENGNSAMVESLLQKAIRLDPKLGLAYLQMGILAVDRRDLEQATSAYKKAIDCDPQMEEPHYRLAQVYKTLGDKPRSQQELALYQQLLNKKQQDTERQRHEIQQFVYTLRSSEPGTQVH